MYLIIAQRLFVAIQSSSVTFPRSVLNKSCFRYLFNEVECFRSYWETRQHFLHYVVRNTVGLHCSVVRNIFFHLFPKFYRIFSLVLVVAILMLMVYSAVNRGWLGFEVSAIGFSLVLSSTYVLEDETITQFIRNQKQLFTHNITQITIQSFTPGSLLVCITLQCSTIELFERSNLDPL